MGYLMWWVLYLVGSFLAAVGLSNCKPYKINMKLANDLFFKICTIILVVGSWFTVSMLIYYKLKKKW